MVDRNLLREFYIDEDELNKAIAGSVSENEGEEDWDVDDFLENEIIGSEQIDVNQITEGTILRVDGGEVLVDIGFKSEGVVSADEWRDDQAPPKAGDKVKVLLEEVEDEFGLILLSKQKADRIAEWEAVISEHDEGDVVTGTVQRKIKGGLLVGIGVNVFLPASQVDIRRPQDIAEYIGKEIKCVILKIDEARRNIVVSRRKLIEDEREELKRKLLAELEEGQVRKGVVKNIAAFGAFVDLGGIDGLLHITDMTWDRISDPHEKVELNQEIEVKVLNIDREKEKIALGVKQMSDNPWDNVSEKYPVGSKLSGQVVNVMTYGAFVKLEPGIEGLVHISEMSWVKRISHPNEMVEVGDEVEVVVLGINEEKQEISLGMKQTQPNPWDNVTEKYPENSRVTGTVRNLTNYGAFIELEEGVDGLLHVSDMSHVKKLSHANEMLKKGDSIECQVLSVDEDRKRIALGLKQLAEDPWETDIPDRYQPGTVVNGQVTKITNFGVFVELENDLEGLLHISELAEHKVENPEEIVSVGEEIEVRILRVDIHDRKIGLSRKMDDPLPDDVLQEMASGGTGGGEREDLKGGGTGSTGPLFGFGAAAEEAPAKEEAEETASDDAPAEEASPEEASADAEETNEED